MIGRLASRVRHLSALVDLSRLQAKLSADDVVGVFSVPYRPHLFTKPKPTTLSLTTAALEKDEVFLILIFIYSEAKRQDQTVSPTRRPSCLIQLIETRRTVLSEPAQKDGDIFGWTWCTVCTDSCTDYFLGHIHSLRFQYALQFL